MSLTETLTRHIGVLNKGDTVSVEVTAVTNAWDSFYGDVSEAPSLVVSAAGNSYFAANHMTIDSGTSPSGKVTVKGSFTAPSTGTYSLNFWLENGRDDSGNYTGTTTLTISGQGQISRKNAQRLQIGNNGQCAVWGNSAMVFTESLFFVRVGNNSFKIDDTGIKKRIGGGSWQNL